MYFEISIISQIMKQTTGSPRAKEFWSSTELKKMSPSLSGSGVLSSRSVQNVISTRGLSVRQDSLAVLQTACQSTPMCILSKSHDPCPPRNGTVSLGIRLQWPSSREIRAEYHRSMEIHGNQIKIWNLMKNWNYIRPISPSDKRTLLSHLQKSPGYLQSTRRKAEGVVLLRKGSKLVFPHRGTNSSNSIQLGWTEDSNPKDGV